MEGQLTIDKPYVHTKTKIYIPTDAEAFGRLCQVCRYRADQYVCNEYGKI